MVKLHDIAKKANVSLTTVSYVLNGRGQQARIHEDTRARVLDAARELGYRPNASARATRTGRFGCAALMQSVQNVYLPPALLHGITEGLSESDMHLAIAEIPLVVEGAADYLPKVVRDLTADGLLVNRIVDIPESFLNVIHSLPAPAIWLNVKQETDCVHPDDEGAGRVAAEMLLERGHERIAYAVYESDGADYHYSVGDRIAGYAAALRAAGRTPHVVHISHEPVPDEGIYDDARIQEAAEILRSPDRPTAIVAYEHNVAFPIAFAAMQLGLKVPGDLSLIVNHAGVDRLSGLGVTAVAYDLTLMGKVAAKTLVEKIARPGDTLPARLVTPVVFPGRTCGPPSRE